VICRLMYAQHHHCLVLGRKCKWQDKQVFIMGAHLDFGHQLRLRAVAGFQHEHHVRGEDACSAARLDEGEKRCRQVETDLQGQQAR